MFGTQATTRSAALTTSGGRHLVLESLLHSRAVRFLVPLLAALVVAAMLPLLHATRAAAADGDPSRLVSFERYVGRCPGRHLDPRRL